MISFGFVGRRRICTALAPQRVCRVALVMSQSLLDLRSWSKHTTRLNFLSFTQSGSVLFATCVFHCLTTMSLANTKLPVVFPVRTRYSTSKGQHRSPEIRHIKKLQLFSRTSSFFFTCLAAVLCCPLRLLPPAAYKAYMPTKSSHNKPFILIENLFFSMHFMHV